MPIEDQLAKDQVKRFSVALGRNLREIREARNLSSEALARKAKLSPTTVLSIEKANGIGRFDTIFRICAALEYDTRSLITWSLELAFEGKDGELQA
jgi:transcriptional regulator with XRE-family HTH domain